MSSHTKNSHIIKSITKYYSADNNKIMSNLISLLLDIKLLKTLPKNILRNLLFIVKSLAENKNTISSKDPSIISYLESTLINHNLSPFFNKYSIEMFHNLIFPKNNSLFNTVPVNLPGYSTYTEKTIAHFILYDYSNLINDNRSYIKSFYKSLPDLRAEKMTDTKSILVARKIRLKPSNKYLEIFWQCFEATCILYNKTVLAIQTAYNDKYSQFVKMRKRGCVFINKEKKQCCNKCETYEIIENKKKQTRTRFFCKTHTKSKLKYDIKLSLIHWRKEFMGDRNNVVDLGFGDWFKNVPYDTKQLAIKTAIANMKTCITNKKSGRIKTFHIKQKSKYFKKQFFHVDHRALKELDDSDFCLFKTLSENEPLHMKTKENEWLHQHFNDYVNKTYNKKDEDNDNNVDVKYRHDMIVTYDSGRYYLIVPHEKKIKKNKIKNKIVSIDPGVRTFHTFYSPDGMVGDLGVDLDIKLLNIHKERDTYISKMDLTSNKLNDIQKTEDDLNKLKRKQKKIENKYDGPKKIIENLNKLKEIKKKIKKTMKKLKGKCKKKLIRRRKHLRKRIYQLDNKIKNVVTAAHWNISSYYCKNYNTIVIPQFDVKNIKKRMKRDRKAKSDTRIRKLMTLSHGKFLERLKHKCKVTGTRLCIVGEEYTTKSCGNCGLLNNPKRSKTYICECGVVAGRDVNAARNILIKYISKCKLEKKITKK